MTRGKSKLTIRHRDPNMIRAKAAGYAARMAEKTVFTSPNLLPEFGEEYGTQLCDAWMKGWYSADRQLKQNARFWGGGSECVKTPKTPATTAFPSMNPAKIARSRMKSRTGRPDSDAMGQSGVCAMGE